MTGQQSFIEAERGYLVGLWFVWCFHFYTYFEESLYFISVSLMTLIIFDRKHHCLVLIPASDGSEQVKETLSLVSGQLSDIRNSFLLFTHFIFITNVYVLVLFISDIRTMRCRIYKDHTIVQESINSVFPSK